MRALYDLGAIDKQTMRELDAACLTQIEVLSAEEIRLLRPRERISQLVFARYLNVLRNLISDWERGVGKPGGLALASQAIASIKCPTGSEVGFTLISMS